MRKNKIVLLSLFLLGVSTNAQNTLRNVGNLKVFEEGQLGLQTNLLNDGAFDENLGLVGFYHETPLTISGAFNPLFYDLDIAVEADVFLETSVAISNSLNLIYGDINLPRNPDNIHLKLLENAFYSGEMDDAKVDGPVAIEEKQAFVFPVGYEDVLRPLGIQFENEASLAVCEYFLENPGNPKSFDGTFNTFSKHITLARVSEKEFWKLKATAPGEIMLTWNARSNLSNLVTKLENITVAGWNIDTRQWDNLGNTFLEGNYTNGSVTSDVVDTASYQIYTLASTHNFNTNLSENYLLTPNGDGANDFLILDVTAASPRNEIKIFNRYGLLVFEKTDYKDEFQGVSNKKVIDKGEKLPGGIYYYIITLKDLGTEQQGFFYLAQ